MPISSTRPEYDEMIGKWIKIRDAVAGEHAVKAKTVQYLPVPLSVHHVDAEYSRAYKNYLHRAKFPAIVGEAVEAMAGLMSRDPSDIEMPSAMDYLRDRATADALSLDDLENRLRHEVITVGRYVLLVDVPADGGAPYIATYPAESLINWRSDGIDLTLAVFVERVRDENPDDPYEDLIVTQWRECAVEDGRYVVRVWRYDEANREYYILSETMPTRRGEPLDFVPAVIVGSRDLVPDPDAIPLLSVVELALHYYRQYADYALQLYMSANATTPYVVGIDTTGQQGAPGESEVPEDIGPSSFWLFRNKDAKPGFIEISGQGLEAQKQSLDEIAQQIQDATLKMVGDGRRSAESGEALRLRLQSKTASLASIANATSAGLERAMRFIATWLGVDADEVSVAARTDFIRQPPDPQLLTALYDGIERGLVPIESLAEYAQRTRITDLPTDDYLRAVPAGQGLVSGGESERQA